MVASLLSGLTKVGKAISSFIDGAVLRGESKKDTFLLVKDLFDLRVRADTFERTWDRVNEAEDAWGSMKYVRKSGVIRTGYEDADAKLRQTYMTVIKTTARSLRTGEVFNMNTGVYHTNLITREDAEDAAWNILSQGQSTDIEIIDQRPVAGVRSK